MGFSGLVPELVVTDINASLQFWCGVVGFTVWYDRPEEHFAYLSLGEAQIMLEQHCPGDRSFVNGALAQPFGRGINFQLAVPSVDEIADRCARQGIALFWQMEERWYRQGNHEVGRRQMIVADPDGYLVRCMQPLGTRSKRLPAPS
ncbi:bleomycin resistance protein [Comamonas sediminis]|uniref:bleomycin resistance protein n=1 Tax=Comamonas sediminis TaxID=1783360 RepID=UPI0034E40C0B